MTKANYSELIVVLDRSGSMSSIRKDMQGGFDTFIAEQRKIPGECRVSLFQFDDIFETVYQGKSLTDVPPLDLIPRGGTALFDAIATAVDRTGERLAAMPEHERPDRVAVLIITDGQENSSQKATSKEVMKRVATQRGTYNWSFSFLGADETSLDVADTLGIGAANAVYWTNTSVGTGAVFDTLSKGFGQYRVVDTAFVSNDALISQVDYERAVDNRTTGASNEQPTA